MNAFLKKGLTVFLIIFPLSLRVAIESKDIFKKRWEKGLRLIILYPHVINAMEITYEARPNVCSIMSDMQAPFLPNQLAISR